MSALLTTRTMHSTNGLDYDYFSPEPSSLHLNQFAHHGISYPDTGIAEDIFQNYAESTQDPLIFTHDDFDISPMQDITRNGDTKAFHKPATSPDIHPHGRQLQIRADSVLNFPRDRKSSRASVSGEEKDLSPAQTRRKAQNRAAQRAFRERKERHVRELEAQLNTMSNKTSTLQSHVDRLKVMLQRAQTENRILKANVSTKHSDSTLLSDSTRAEPAPLMFVRTSASKSPPSSPNQSCPLGASTFTSTSTRYLDPGAAWDLLQAHPLFIRGDVDVGQVCEKLKWLARMEGTSGPVFDEAEVRQIIEEIAATAAEGSSS